jgi:hypothetical protein
LCLATFLQKNENVDQHLFILIGTPPFFFKACLFPEVVQWKIRVAGMWDAFLEAK